jgi:hypothetical protein
MAFWFGGSRDAVSAAGWPGGAEGHGGSHATKSSREANTAVVEDGAGT